jgi:hypothetical protein
MDLLRGKLGLAGGGGSASAAEPGSADAQAPAPTVHEDLLQRAEEHGKIIMQDPVLEGAGVSVHGVMPIAVGHAAKRTGGSPHEALSGVAEPREHIQGAHELQGEQRGR